MINENEAISNLRELFMNQDKRNKYSKVVKNMYSNALISLISSATIDIVAPSSILSMFLLSVLNQIRFQPNTFILSALIESNISASSGT